MIERVDDQLITRVNIAIYPKDDNAYGIGCELVKRERLREGSFRDTVYFICSIYGLRSELTSQRKAVEYACYRALQHVNQSDKLIIFHSTLPTFRERNYWTKRMGKYAGEKQLAFKQVKQVKYAAVKLSIDSVIRKSTIEMEI